MTTSNLIVVFSGTAERAATLHMPQHLVLHETELLKILGQVVFLYPQVVILEDLPESNLAQEVYTHLRSVQPVPLLILTDTPQRWELPADGTVLFLPRSATSSDVWATIETLLTGLRLPIAG